MKYLVIIFCFFCINICLGQNNHFYFKTEAEVGYLISRAKYMISKNVPLSASLKIGSGIRLSRSTYIGLFLTASYMRFVLNSKNGYIIVINDNNGPPTTTTDYFVAETEGIMMGPTVFVNQEIFDKLSIEFQTSYLVPANAKTDWYFYSPELNRITDPLNGTTSSRDNTASQAVFQLGIAYDIYKGKNLIVDVKPYYSYYLTLESTIDNRIYDILNVNQGGNLHSLGLGIILTLL